MAATVHFAAKELAGDRRERPSEIDVFNAQLRRADRSGREGRYGRAIVLAYEHASMASLRVDAFVSGRGELLTRRKVHPADRFRFRMAVATSRASSGGRRCSHSLTAASAKSEESGDTER
jgi:hypothetical protein